MSKHKQDFELNTSSVQALELCQEVAVRMGWRVLSLSSSTLTLKEASPQITSFTWPARIDVSISANSDKTCIITLDGSISGVGPIQRNHLQGQMGRFLNDLSLAVDRKNPSNEAPASIDRPSPSLSDELLKLKALMDGGVLTAEEFAAAKSRLLG